MYAFLHITKMLSCQGWRNCTLDNEDTDTRIFITTTLLLTVQSSESDILVLCCFYSSQMIAIHYGSTLETLKKHDTSSLSFWASLDVLVRLSTIPYLQENRSYDYTIDRVSVTCTTNAWSFDDTFITWKFQKHVFSLSRNAQPCQPRQNPSEGWSGGNMGPAHRVLKK